MWEFLTSIGFLIPPGDDTDATSMRRWRYSVGITLMSLTFVQVGALSLIFGFTPLFQGFAQASDLNNVKDQIRSVQINQLDEKIINSRTMQCKAIREQNGDAKQFAEQRIQWMIENYRALSGAEYRLPDCSEL